MNSFVKMWAVRVADLTAAPGDVIDVTRADGTSSTVTLAMLAPGETTVWLIVPTRRSAARPAGARPAARPAESLSSYLDRQ